MGCGNIPISPAGIPPPDAQVWDNCTDTGLLQVLAITELVPIGVDALGHGTAKRRRSTALPSCVSRISSSHLY